MQRDSGGGRRFRGGAPVSLGISFRVRRRLWDCTHLSIIVLALLLLRSLLLLPLLLLLQRQQLLFTPLPAQHQLLLCLKQPSLNKRLVITSDAARLFRARKELSNRRRLRELRLEPCLK